MGKGEPFGERISFDLESGFATPTLLKLEVSEIKLAKQLLLQEVAVKDTDVTRRGSFSRVLGVDRAAGKVLFPTPSQTPKQGSPSLLLASKPYQLKEAIRASYKLNSWSGAEEIMGSGVALSNKFLSTAAHVVPQGSKCRCMNGDLIRDEHFSSKETPRHHLEIVSRDSSRDFALMCVVVDPDIFPDTPMPELRGRFTYFLLPSSPEEVSICVASYPGVSAFMERAGLELLSGVSKLASVWSPGYKSSMKEELEEARERHKTWSEEEIERVVQKKLFLKLQETFSGHCTGAHTASFGKLKRNGSEWATTCSTLYGSSGGPVCVLEDYGYFCGWHIGASDDYRSNEVVTCDEPVFVEAYFTHVLEDLPTPGHAVWRSWNLGRFFQWIRKHEARFRGSLSDAAQAWVEAASKASRKRKAV